MMITVENYATFEPRSAQFVRLTILLDAKQGEKSVAIDDINIYTAEKTHEVPVQTGGRWGITLDFPLVPVTAFLNPRTQTVITMSSYLEDRFEALKHNSTYSATWDAKAERIAERNISSTGHDMFCPGTSYDESGKVIITGGSSPKALSVYDPVQDSYETPKDMSTNKPLELKIPRGYQGQKFLPTGKVFKFGGSWSGDGDKFPNRDGEIYDPASRATRVLKNITADYIKMDISVSCNDSHPTGSPCVKDDWRQHHAWLFAWKNNSIFHAGPSRSMNWFFPERTAKGVNLTEGLVNPRRQESK